MSRRIVLPALAVLVGLVAGCTAQKSQVTPSTPSDTAGKRARSELDGTAWRLEDLAGTPALPDVEATLEFMADGKIAGKGSCNRFFGTATITGATIAFGPIGSTKMACLDENIANQETRYFQALEGAERYELVDGKLLVHAKGLAAPLRFVSAPASGSA